MTDDLSDNSNELSNPSFFCKEDMVTPYKTSLEACESFTQNELNRTLVFKHIEKTQPTTRYRVSKETGISQTTIRLIVRDLTFAGVVHEKIAPHDNGKTYKILTIPSSHIRPGIPILSQGNHSKDKIEVEE